MNLDRDMRKQHRISENPMIFVFPSITVWQIIAGRRMLIKTEACRRKSVKH